MKRKKKVNGVNVLMFGFDSLSRNAFMRKLPKSYEYLTKVLKADVLKGYNIVGDGTPQALIPLLTGFTELELPEARKRKFSSTYVNSYPFIWKEYQKAGYVRSLSFKKKPQNNHISSQGDSICRGSTKNWNVQLQTKWFFQRNTN